MSRCLENDTLIARLGSIHLIMEIHARNELLLRNEHCLYLCTHYTRLLHGNSLKNGRRREEEWSWLFGGSAHCYRDTSFHISSRG